MRVMLTQLSMMHVKSQCVDGEREKERNRDKAQNMDEYTSGDKLLQVL